MVDILSVGLVNSALWPNNVYEVWGDPKKNIKPYISLTFTDRADVFLNEDAKRKETRDQLELILASDDTYHMPHYRRRGRRI
jgi:hypothetical protein